MYRPLREQARSHGLSRSQNLWEQACLRRGRYIRRIFYLIRRLRVQGEAPPRSLLSGNVPKCIAILPRRSPHQLSKAVVEVAGAGEAAFQGYRAKGQARGA